MTSSVTSFVYMGASTFERQESSKPYDIPKQPVGSNDIYNPVQPHQIYSQTVKLHDGESSADSSKFLCPGVEMLDFDKILLTRDLPALDSDVRNFMVHFSSIANFPRLSKLQSSTYSHSRPKGFAVGLPMH